MRIAWGSRLAGFQIAKPVLLFSQIVDRPLSRAFEPARLDERRDLVELTGVEKCTVPATDVHDCT